MQSYELNWELDDQLYIYIYIFILSEYINNITRVLLILLIYSDTFKYVFFLNLGYTHLSMFNEFNLLIYIYKYIFMLVEFLVNINWMAFPLNICVLIAIDIQ